MLDATASNGFRVEEEYIHLDGWRPVAVIRPDTATGMANPQVFPILTDHLGTPRKVLDGSTGQTRWSWDAKQPFGHEMPLETPTAGLPAFTFDLRFPGQHFDEETGLFHNGFRDYHPGLGRYVQSDPLGLQAGWNTFVYVNSKIFFAVDPLGLSSQVGMGFSGTLGILPLGTGLASSIGLSVPDDISQLGCYQLYLSGQWNTMIGAGLYAAIGLTFNASRNSGPVQTSGGTFRYEEAGIGWGLGWGASQQGTKELDEDGSAFGWIKNLLDSKKAKEDLPSGLSIGIFPKKGATFGGWAGTGFTISGTLATPTSKKCKCQ